MAFIRDRRGGADAATGIVARARRAAGAINFQFQQNELRWGGGAPTSYESEFYYQFGFGRTDNWYAEAVLLEMIDPVLGCVPRYYAPTTCAEVLLSPFGQGSPSGAGWSNAPLNPLVRPTVRRFDFADWSNRSNEPAEVQWLVYNRDPDLDELYILQLAMMPSRITWTSAVPEPSAWVMMIMGFAGVGIAMRRRRGHREAAPDPAARISHGDTPTGSQGIA